MNGASSPLEPLGSAPPGYVPYQAAGDLWRYAGFWARLGAFVLDYFVAVLFGLPGIAIGSQLGSGAGEGLAGVMSLAGVAAFLVVYCLMVASGDGSVGHRAVGVRIVDSRTGLPISAGRALGRRLASILSYLPCWLGFVWMGWDRRKQTWHDKLASTVVVRVN